MPPRAAEVFLNIPYDADFQLLYLAYIVGVVELGFRPRATLAIPGGEARLDRIFQLICHCRYSIHDLSRVELDLSVPPTPRFNMPFELGMAVAWAKLHPTRHTFFVFEAMNRRAQKSVSDMNGADFNIHDGTPEGVMRELSNAFVRKLNPPSFIDLMASYRAIRKLLPRLKRLSGSSSVFEARTFEQIIAAASSLREKRLKALSRS
jgi:hypothetical protein